MKKLPLSLHEFAQVAVSLIIAGLAIVNLINHPVRWVNVITLAAGLALAVIATVVIIRGGVHRFNSL